MDRGQVLLPVIPLAAAHLSRPDVVCRGLKHVETLMADSADAILEVPCDPAPRAVFIPASSVVLADLPTVAINPHAGNCCLINHLLFPRMILRHSSVLQFDN